MLQSGAEVIGWSNLGIDIAATRKQTGKLSMRKQGQKIKAFCGYSVSERDSVENHYCEVLRYGVEFRSSSEPTQVIA